MLAGLRQAYDPLVITSVDAFLRYFAGVSRRAVRDIGGLPAEAEGWRPPTSDSSERGWTIAQLVAHMAASRLFFVAAYRGEGWHAEPWSKPCDTREQWVAALNESAQLMAERLSGTPDEWLTRRLPGIDSAEQLLSGWRILMMGTEHDVHHRSQIDTYAGIAGWEVQQIFGRRAEDVGLSPAT
ncbi:MAG TPA: DinB family protein [Candidatus Dormibacteraeota bacterium]|nr:DinB family protein [Candidatus Dormibacteraeota bacterium]